MNRVLVDTSVWVDHLRRGRADLAEPLSEGRVVVHDFVLGELLLGHASPKSGAMELLECLPRLQVVEHESVVAMLTAHRLRGSGIGWIDAHLLAACLVGDAWLWSLDKRLAEAARRLGVAI